MPVLAGRGHALLVVGAPLGTAPVRAKGGPHRSCGTAFLAYACPSVGATVLATATAFSQAVAVSSSPGSPLNMMETSSP
jgi:hypothetical protein